MIMIVIIVIYSHLASHIGETMPDSNCCWIETTCSKTAPGSSDTQELSKYRQHRQQRPQGWSPSWDELRRRRPLSLRRHCRPDLARPVPAIGQVLRQAADDADGAGANAASHGLTAGSVVDALGADGSG